MTARQYKPLQPTVARMMLESFVRNLNRERENRTNMTTEQARAILTDLKREVRG